MRPWGLFPLAVGFLAFCLPLLLTDLKIIRPEHYAFVPRTIDNNKLHKDDETHQASFANAHDDNSPEAKFRNAASKGDIAEAAKLVTQHGEQLIHSEMWHGHTPLFDAARAGKQDMVKFLTERGAVVDKVNQWGESPVSEAASMGHFNIIWYLADHGANLTREYDSSGHTGLILSAIRYESIDALVMLKNYGFSLEQRYWRGATALHEATRQGHEKVVDWLIAQGVNVSATNDLGQSAAHEAADVGNIEILRKLLDLNAYIGEPGSALQASIVIGVVRKNSLATLEDLSSKTNLDLDAADTHGQTPLIEAARDGNLAILEWLLSKGVNASKASRRDDAPIFVAAYHDHTEAVWRLEAAGANLSSVDSHGSNVLIAAAYHRNERQVRALLEKGVLDVNYHTPRGDTALAVAAARGAYEIVKILHQQGATGLPRGTRADTPLHRAARAKRIEVMRYLIEEMKLDVEAKDARGRTPLIEAAKADSVAACEYLLEHGASANAGDRHGMTAFLEASRRGSLTLMKVLVGRGAFAGARNNDGFDAFEVSKWAPSHDAVVEYLSSLGLKSVHEEHPHQ